MILHLRLLPDRIPITTQRPHVDLSAVLSLLQASMIQDSPDERSPRRLAECW